jgi:hypothetical protein
MNQMTQFLIRHGLPVVFIAVLAKELSFAFPALPWLLAAGALAAIGKFNLAPGFPVAVSLGRVVNQALKSDEVEPLTSVKGAVK